MKLDPRIENENLIYTPFSNNETNLKGEGYFANVMGAFTDLSRCAHGTLARYDLDKEFPYYRKGSRKRNLNMYHLIQHKI